MRHIITFFDRLEDKIRTRLSKHPLVYALLGGIAIVLFWRGIWYMADEIRLSSLSSVAISIVILFSTGLFVSFFVGENIILTGLKHEKKLAEQTESEIRTEKDELDDVKKILVELKREISDIKKIVGGGHQ